MYNENHFIDIFNNNINQIINNNLNQNLDLISWKLFFNFIQWFCINSNSYCDLMKKECNSSLSIIYINNIINLSIQNIINNNKVSKI